MTASVGRRQRTYQPRDFPAVFALLTRVALTEGELVAREAANRYKRQSLRLAFQAGWNTAPHPQTVVNVLKSDLMSDLGKGAFYAGAEARQAHDTPPTKRGLDGNTRRKRKRGSKSIRQADAPGGSAAARRRSGCGG